MKVISSLYSKICRLESSSGEDEYIDFKMPGKHFLSSYNFLALRFKFSRSELDFRIRTCLRALKLKKQLENKTDILCSVLVKLEQIAELYSTLKLEYEQNDLIKPGELEEQSQDLELKLMTSSCEDYYEYSIFTSKEGVIIYALIDQNCDLYPGKNLVLSLSIGYAFEHEMEYSDLLKRCIKFILNKNKNAIFEVNEFQFSKEEFIKFMNALNWILQNIEIKFDTENPDIFYLELKNASCLSKQ